MNYRHAFHAGNFADVIKHVALTRILAALKRKETAFRLIDTHAGAGLYDLSSPDAERAQEWRNGIGRLDQARMSDAAEALAAEFRAAVAATRSEHGTQFYPGSPHIGQRATRTQDRMIFAEAHAGTAQKLRAAMKRDRRAKVLEQDGWTILNSVIPPPERRGVVLIDPAFEDADEFALIAKYLPAAIRKWPTGVFALWHPVKDASVVARFVRLMTEEVGAAMLRTELAIDPPSQRGLSACGLLIVNPPWRLDEELDILLPELARALGRGAARWRNDRLAPRGADVPSHNAPRGGRRKPGENS